jgi:secreted trypsin-like serine protease
MHDTDAAVCPGDSGGPLVRHDDAGKWVQVGIVSTGERDCAPGKVNTYTRASAYAATIASAAGQLTQCAKNERNTLLYPNGTTATVASQQVTSDDTQALTALTEVSGCLYEDDTGQLHGQLVSCA